MDAASTLEPLIPDPLPEAAPEPVVVSPERAANGAPATTTGSAGDASASVTPADAAISTAEEAIRALLESMPNLEAPPVASATDSAPVQESSRESMSWIRASRRPAAHRFPRRVDRTAPMRLLRKKHC